jgi:hypothetical protein
MKLVLAIMSLFSAGVLAFAQTSTSASAPSAPSSSTQVPTKNPVAASLRMLLPRSQNNILGAIEAMPTDKFSYKPTPDQVTFAHLVVHIVASNNMLCSKVADVAAPKAEAPKESDSKDQLLSAAKASFAFCSDAIGKMDDSKLGDSVEVFGNGRQLPRAMGALGLASGWADHYAEASMYLRLNNILPPSAQVKK